MTSFYTITKPEATRNLIKNPSAEVDTNFASGAGGTVTRVMDRAYRGAYSFKVVIGSPTAGIELTTPALANAAHYLTAHLYSANANQTYTFAVGTTTREAALLANGANWQRWGAAFSAAECNGWTLIDVLGDLAGTFYVDGVQLEQKLYPTTYIDGDEPGGLWLSERHGSASDRAATYRLGGRETDLEAYAYRVTNVTEGIGAPPVRVNAEGYALLPGARYQSQHIEPRVIDLVLGLKGATMAELHSVRREVLDLFGPGDGQAVRLGYSGANADRPVTIAGRYTQGLQFDNVRGFVERPVVRLWCDDPYWREDDQQTAVIDTGQTIASAAYGLGRIGGEWQTLGTGFNGAVQVLAADRNRNRLYAGGAFTTVDGVSANRVGYWDGDTFHALGSGLNGTVTALAVAPNGDVWVGGSFTTAGGSTADGLARWNLATSTWTAFTNGTPGDTIYAIAIAPDGTVYFGGNFLGWDGLTEANYIAGYDGAAFFDLGAVPDGVHPFTTTYFPRFPHALAVASDGTLYFGGANLDISPDIVTYLYQWDGSWTELAATNSVGLLSGVHALAFDAAGNLYVAGAFSTLGGIAAAGIAVYNGTSFKALGNGLSSACLDLAIGEDGLLIVPANTVDDSSVDFLNVWNGSNWLALDVDLGDITQVNAVAAVADALYLGLSASGSATAAELTTVDNGSTAPTYPVITLAGPGRLVWLENQTTGKRLYFHLTANAGETVTIDLRPGQRRVVSSWWGRLADEPLPFSNMGSFHLTKEGNVIAALVAFSDGNTGLALNWQPVHVSVDGTAV